MREESTATRRATLRRGAFALAGVAGLAGCLATGVEDIPDPLVVRAEPTDLSEVTESQTVEVSALVHNVGATGEVVVRVETFTATSPEAVDTASTTLSMESDSQQRVTVDIEVSAVAKRLDATAEPAE